MADATLLRRIAKDGDKASAEDMSGGGVESGGGRWSAKGTAVVYSSTTISLATLKTLAHLAGAVAIRDAFLVKITVPRHVWRNRKTVAVAALPVTWLAQPSGPASVNVGNNRLAANIGALMLVPSVIIPEESNALINPAHPEAAQLSVTVVRQFMYDPHLK